MKNKVITIYELLGRINDNKAPKKIKVTGHVYEFDESLNLYVTDEENCRTILGGVIGEINLVANAFNDIVEILEENDEWEDIEDITLNGKDIGYGILKDWLDFTPNDNEQKICSCIETLGIAINQLIKNQKYLKEKLEEK